MSVTLPTASVQYLTTNVESLTTKEEILEERCNDAEFIRDGARAKEALLAAQINKSVKQISDFQEHTITILQSVCPLFSKTFSNVQSVFHAFCLLLLNQLKRMYRLVDNRSRVLPLRN